MSHKPQLADSRHCTGCFACIDSCPKQAISKIISADGHFYVKINYDQCISCGRCEKNCPVVNEEEYSSNIIIKSNPYSFYCTNSGLAKRSTSGGAFIAFAASFINNGGYVCGAIMENNSVKHIISNKMEDISLMQGSKYIQSDMHGVYLEIQKFLNEGHKVLFCGMGCQSAAILSFFKKHRNKNLLYVIDMICGGVPSRLLVDKFIEGEKNIKQIIGFRDKEKYILTCKDNNNNIIELKNSRPLPLYGYFSNLTNRYCCGNCAFCGAERLSDITIGDLWEKNKSSNIHKSVIVTHTEKGEELLQTTNDITYKSINWDFAKINFRFIFGKTYNNYRLQRIFLPSIFKYLSYRNICGFYGCEFNNPLWILLKIFNKLFGSIQSVIIKHNVRKILNKIE